MEKTLEALNEQRRKEALEKAEQAYCNPESVHYRDNERFAWAVQTINKKYDELKEDNQQKQS